jgi:hypothetical protein
MDIPVRNSHWRTDAIHKLMVRRDWSKNLPMGLTGSCIETGKERLDERRRHGGDESEEDELHLH